MTTTELMLLPIQRDGETLREMWDATIPTLVKEIKMNIRDDDKKDDGGMTDGDRWVASAIDRAGVPDGDLDGLWVGGLACPFGEYYEPTNAGWVETINEAAFDETLEMIYDEDVDWHASFCLDHACYVNTGLLGNTNTRGEMGAYFWTEKKETDLGPPGLYALAKVGMYEGSPGMLAAEAIRRDGVQGMSIGFYILEERLVEDDEKFEPKALFEVMRIKLVEASGVDHAAYRTTFLRAGVYNSDMDKKSEKKSAYEYSASAPKTRGLEGVYQYRGCDCSTKMLGEDADIRQELEAQRAEIERLAALIAKNENTETIEEKEESREEEERKTFTPFPI